MNQARFMGVIEACRRLGDVVGGQVELERAPFLDDVLQIASFDILHDEVMNLVLVIDVVGTEP